MINDKTKENKLGMSNTPKGLLKWKVQTWLRDKETQLYAFSYQSPRCLIFISLILH